MSRTIKLHCLFFLAATGLLLTSNTLQAATQEPVQSLQFIKMLLGLLFVIGIIAALAWAYRRFGNLSYLANHQIRLESVLTLGNKEKLVIVRTGQRRLLLGVTASQINALLELEAKKEPDLPDKHSDVTGRTSGFTQVLKQMTKVGQGR